MSIISRQLAVFWGNTYLIFIQGLFVFALFFVCCLFVVVLFVCCCFCFFLICTIRSVSRRTS